MGAYLNPGNQSYQMAVNSEVFVDKTEMLLYLNSVINTAQRFVSVSRPRRFGKTMAADMICAYYDREADSRELFKTLKVASHIEDNDKPVWDFYLGRFDVIRVVMTDFMDDSENVPDMLRYLTEEVAEELIDAFPDIKPGNRIKLRTIMNKIYGKTKRQFVVVIDEWDAIFREWKEDTEGQTKYLDFLRDWLKDKPYIAMAYMTGILPIKKYGEHSALNMFTEYSMEAPRQLAQYTGFTKDEVERLCDDYGMSFTDISNWYDGYVVSDRIPPEKREEYRQGKYDEHKVSIYSPLSVVESMTTGQIKNYWNKTETYEALAEYIRKDYDGLKDAVALLMDGQPYLDAFPKTIGVNYIITYTQGLFNKYFLNRLFLVSVKWMRLVFYFFKIDFIQIYTTDCAIICGFKIDHSVGQVNNGCPMCCAGHVGSFS